MDLEIKKYWGHRCLMGAIILWRGSHCLKINYNLSKEALIRASTLIAPKAIVLLNYAKRLRA